ncbi:MAG: hypothetical protein ABIO21_05880 [Pseudomonas sp.]
MPEIKRVKLANNTTIEQQLHNCAIDLLPERIARHRLVHWITEHDELVKRPDRYTSRESGGELFSQVVTSIFQEKISFYFAAIFHIGRMLQVSNFVLENVRDAEQADNFKNLSLSLSETLTGRTREAKATETLSTVITASKEHYSNQRALALEWWDIWQQEVDDLRDVVETRPDRYQHSYQRINYSLIARAIRLESRLKTRMIAEDVRFKTDVSSPVNPGGSSLNTTTASLMFLCVAELAERGDRYGSAARQLWDEWLEIERSRRNAIQEQIILDQLKTKYRDRNPFDSFKPGRQPANLELRELLKENQLPDEQASPWKAMWERSLEHMPRGNLPLTTLSDLSSTLALRQADSIIKNSAAENILPTESWENFIQRMFENNWIKEVGKRAGAANKTADDATVWAVDDFASFVDSVVFALNEMGYALECPSADRLKTLLDKASRGESLNGKNSW